MVIDRFYFSSHFAYAETVSLRAFGKFRALFTMVRAIIRPKQIKVFTGEHFFYTYYDPSLGTVGRSLPSGMAGTY